MSAEYPQSNRIRRSGRRLALACVFLLVLLGVWLVERKRSSSASAPGPASLPPRVATTSSPPVISAPATIEVPIGERILAQYLAPGATVEEDLTWMSRLLENVRILVKGENPLPLGSNEELAAALQGKNARHEIFVRASHQSLNSKGQIVDRWGTPLFFHAQSADRIEIRSAGPDRLLWTADDVQRNANGTFSRGIPKLGTTSNEP